MSIAVGSAPAAAFAEQVLPHEPALLAAALALCGGCADQARDLVQDTLERALRSFESSGPRTSVRSWLIAIAHNLFIDRCRRDQRGPRLVDLDAADDVATREAAGEASQEETPTPAWADIGPAELRATVARLDEEFRVVFELFEFECCSYDEIAARLRVPKSTVGTRLVRARRKLRRLLETGQEES